MTAVAEAMVCVLPVVAAQVEFEKHILKPGLIFKGKGLKSVAFKLWLNIIQPASPHPVPGGPWMSTTRDPHPPGSAPWCSGTR
jgi:hypothetical protein